MIVFDKELLENTYLVNEAKKLNEQGFIPNEQLKEIKAKLPILKSHNNILIRIGFYILGSFLMSSILGIFALVSINSVTDNFWISTLIYTIIAIVGSEFLASQQKLFGYGIDDAFILAAEGFFCVTLGLLFDSPLAGFIGLFLVGLIACIRYVHTLSALLSLIGLTVVVCYPVLQLKMIDAAFLPFLLFFLALALYFIYHKLNGGKQFRYYANSIAVLQGFSLLLGYFSMNYLVVRELSESMLNIHIAPGHDIPFAFLFYGFTFLVPIFYIVYSLYRKDKLMLIIGFLTFGFSIYTIRFYYHVLPIEAALILGGMVLFAGAYFAIRKLKDKETGITFKPARGADADILPNIEALIVNSQVDLKPMENQSNMPFGGGGFSGGGAGESF